MVTNNILKSALPPVLVVVPAAVAEVQAPGKGDLLVHHHDLLVVRPQQHTLARQVVRVPQDLEGQ